MPNNCFPYPGNKARHSKWILEHIPEHECYVELFGGAAGVLFNKPRSKIEVYNDLNGDIPHFFRVLRDRGDELQEWLRNVPYSREVYREWRDEFLSGRRCSRDIERAGRFFTLRYQSFGGALDNTASWRSPTHQRESTKFTTKIESLLKFRDRLRDVHIENLDAFELIDKHDSKGTLFYCDPPYLGTEHRYQERAFDHQRFYNKLSACKASVMVSYDEIPPWFGESWSVAAKDSNFSVDAAGGTKEATEYLIMNYDIDGESVMSELGQSGLSAYQ